ncbi:MAG: type II toxin-antitoxin system PrlF family antitoxin [Kiloniellales bacterium]
MVEIVSRLTSRARTTIPKAVRDALALEPNDSILYRIEGGSVVLCKATTLDVAFLSRLQASMIEWSSPEDEEAYSDL